MTAISNPVYPKMFQTHFVHGCPSPSLPALIFKPESVWRLDSALYYESTMHIFNQPLTLCLCYVSVRCLRRPEGGTGVLKLELRWLRDTGHGCKNQAWIFC